MRLTALPLQKELFEFGGALLEFGGRTGEGDTAQLEAVKRAGEPSRYADGREPISSCRGA